MSDWLESTFNSYDGTTLFYRYKQPASQTNNALLFLHRGHEHSGRIVSFADKLAQDDYWCFAFDLRGHGQSGGTRAWAENFDTWVRDLNSFAGHIRQRFGIELTSTVLIANSVGSVIAVRWILNYGARLKGCILGAPAFSIKLYIPLALPFLRMVSKFSKHRFVTSYVRSSLLTRDENEAQAYDADPLITKKIGVNVLVTLFDATKNCFTRLKDFDVPVLIFTAQKDHIVHNRFHKTFYSGISSRHKKHVMLNDFRHAIFHEKEQHLILDPSRKFLTNVFKNEGKQLPMVVPQAYAHTVQEFNRLQAQGTFGSRIYYSVFRRILQSIGRYSDGIAIGLDHGFDSGLSLDYVYQNKPRGRNGLGRFADRVYLASVGWKGIRIRKQNIINTLSTITHLLHNDGYTPVILDIASGPGRYLFELQQQQAFPIHLYLNDENVEAIARARKLAEHHNAPDTHFLNQNVFNSFRADDFTQRPNVIVVSGLFELYENNQLVHKVTQNLYDLLADGGYLIYTGQPWHPQLELVGRLLNNRYGQRWVMRRRIQQEMDKLVESAGFNKLSTESDDFGIFTVSCAHKKTNNSYGEKTDGQLRKRA